MSRLRRRWGDLQLRGKGTVVVAIPLVALLSAVVLSVIATHDEGRSAAAVATLRQVTTQITAADGLVADIATDNSDYLLVGKPGLCGVAKQDDQRLDATLVTLSVQVSGSPVQQVRIARIQTLTAVANRLAAGTRWRAVDSWGSAVLLALGALGSLVAVRLFTRGISTREADLTRARSFLENVLTAGPMVVVRTGGRDGGATYVSPNCERVLGISPELVTSPEFWTGLAPADVAKYYESAARLYGDDAPAFLELESSFELDGERRHLAVLLTRETIYDDGGLLVFFLDVTARRQAEQQAAERQRELRAITAASPDIIAVFDADLRLRWASEAFTSVLGYRVADWVGALVDEIIHESDLDLLADGVRSVISGGAEDFTVHVRARHASGRWVTLEGHGRPSLGPGGDPVAAVSVLRDVTERIQLEAELVEARDAANAASVAKSEFLSRMSHELRTPLNVVLGFTQLLQMDDLGVEQQDWLGQILLAGRHLLDLINEVLDIARIESGAMPLSPEVVSIHAVVAETVESMRPIAADRNLTITGPWEAADLFVKADRQRLKQVMLNLLSNAVKYNKDGGSIDVRTSVDGGVVRTCITDTGIGIAPQYLQRLFTPFDRLGAEDSSVEGTGVGLSLSLRLIQAMNGSVTVESVAGAGSTFTVALPEVESPLENGVTHPQDLDGDFPHEHRASVAGTVLYIEDNLTNLNFMRRVIDRRPGIRLVHALQGGLGLELARGIGPDVVLLDLHLPDMSGADVLLQLRADPVTRDVPIFIVSADATGGQVERLTDAGASGYFTKPLHVPQILALLDGALESISAHEGK